MTARSTTLSTTRLAWIGASAAAVFLAASAVLTTVVFPPLAAVDEGAHTAHAYAVSAGRLPSVLDPQAGGPYEYRANRTLYTAHHPPLFPALVGPAIRAGNELGSPEDAVRVARLVSVLWGALAVLATAGLLREIVPTRPAVWIAGSSLVATTPLVAHISGLVYNDALALAVTTGVSWAGLRVLRLGPSPPRMAALTLGATLASLTRISAVPIALAAVAVAVVGARRSGADRRQQRRVLLWPLAAMGLGAGWFYARNLVEYGDVSGGDELYELLDRRPRSASTLVEPAFVQARLNGLWTNREWGRGKYGIGPIDTLVEFGLAAVVVGGLASLVVMAVRRPGSLDLAIVAFGLATVVAVLAGFAVHVTSGGTPHSRYLFGLLWLVGLAFAGGLARIGPRAATSLLAALFLAAAAVSIVGIDQVLRNTDLLIGPWGDLATYTADGGVLTQATLGTLAVLAAAGATIAVLSYGELRARERSSPVRDAPKTPGRQ